MKADRHETVRQIIDKTLVGSASEQEQKSVAEHLQACAECREYLRAGTRAIAGLSGFSFEVDPGLQSRVCSSLEQRARQLEARRPSLSRLVWSYGIGLLLTAAGSFVTLQLGPLAAHAFGLEPAHVRHDLIAYWVLPSLYFTLLLPALPLLSATWTNRKGSAL